MGRSRRTERSSRMGSPEKIFPPCALPERIGSVALASPQRDIGRPCALGPVVPLRSIRNANASFICPS